MGKNKLSEKVIIDDRGRITIPESIRERHNFSPGEQFEIIDENDKLILKIFIPKQKTVESSTKWGKNTFFRAGETTFGE
ncbi:MAG: AbrB/MazE/SpoVT family DNA-binding domain-containing protein [Promethearchaeota archaeon]